MNFNQNYVDELFRIYQGQKVRAFIIQNLEKRELSISELDEVLSTCVLKVHRIIIRNKFKGDSSVETYLNRAIINDINDRVKKSSKFNKNSLEELESFSDDWNKSSTLIEEKDRKKVKLALEDCINQLPDRCKAHFSNLAELIYSDYDMSKKESKEELRNMSNLASAQKKAKLENRCLPKLRGLIKNHPILNKILKQIK